MRLVGRRERSADAAAGVGDAVDAVDAAVEVTLDASGQPVVHVVRGTPDDVELAALVAGLAAARATADEDDDAPSSAWTRASRTRRTPGRGAGAGAGAAPGFGAAGRGPDAWRRSLR